MAGLDRDDYLSGYRRLTSAVHERGSKIALQLVHAGAQTRRKWLEGHTPLAPSSIEDRTYRTAAREMTVAELKETVESFGQAARRGVEAGCQEEEAHWRIVSPEIDQKSGAHHIPERADSAGRSHR